MITFNQGYFIGICLGFVLSYFTYTLFGLITKKTYLNGYIEGLEFQIKTNNYFRNQFDKK